MSSRLLPTGFIAAALTLFVPILWPVPVMIGIIAIGRGAVKAGVTLIVLSAAMAIAGAFLIQEFFVKPYRVPGESMKPTLDKGNRFVVWRRGAPSVGDIVVFHPPQGAEDGICGATGLEWMPEREKHACHTPTKGKSDVNFIRRIVAGPGDRIKVDDGHVILNGTRQDEPFVTACTRHGACELPTEITIPPEHYFMMGDNRGPSRDSRYWGPVPSDWIIGRALAIYWPTKDLGGI